MTFKATLLSKFPPANFTFKGLDFPVDVVDVPLKTAALTESSIADFAPMLLEPFVDVVIVAVQQGITCKTGATLGAGVRSLPCVDQPMLGG